METPSLAGFVFNGGEMLLMEFLKMAMETNWSSCQNTPYLTH
jgi:hypothetical protein